MEGFLFCFVVFFVRSICITSLLLIGCGRVVQSGERSVSDLHRIYETDEVVIFIRCSFPCSDFSRGSMGSSHSSNSQSLVPQSPPTARNDFPE